MSATPRSEIFDDVYFSAVDGLAETRHVFLEGNNLPDAWMGDGAGCDEFVIAETGFGTGLNFLAAWDLFARSAVDGQNLHFISFEKYPLSVEQIGEYLAPWKDQFKTILPVYLNNYPDQLVGVQHVQMDEHIELTLIFDDVNEAIPKLEARVDAWFLDGFKPSSNPDMWSETVFSNMARLGKAGCSFATFTAAGFVKRGLMAAGFEVDKVRGFGTKRDMLVGRKA
jgi:tRNA 5-methylaminomethyl-2-thiouridine biosynthesis bifunctional protein